ncbi:MAG: hypothetical protein WC275_01960 [Bacilli bacterium]
MTKMQKIINSEYVKSLDYFIIKYDKNAKNITDLQSIKAFAEALVELILLLHNLKQGVWNKDFYQRSTSSARQYIKKLDLMLHKELMEEFEQDLLELNYLITKEEWYDTI